MFEFDICTTPQGWVGAEVTPEHVDVAKGRWQERQAHCYRHQARHIVEPVDCVIDDFGWSGDLGEMLVKDYLEQRTYEHHCLANVRKSEYDPDFWIAGRHIDVKTRRQDGDPRYGNDYYVTVSNEEFALAPTHEIAGFLFCDYAYPAGFIYLVGKISYKQFNELKIRRDDPNSWDVPITSNSWDVPITSLTPPLRWQKAS